MNRQLCISPHSSSSASAGGRGFRSRRERIGSPRRAPVHRRDRDLAAHAAVDSFIAAEPGRRRRPPLARARHVLRAGPRRGRLSALAGGRAGGARGGLRAPRARGSGTRDRGRAGRGRPRRGLDGFLLSRSASAARTLRGGALALAQGWPASLLPPSGIALAAVLVAYWLVVPVAIGILATHRPRADVAPTDLGRAYEEVTLQTSDGLDLAAWYVPSRNGAAVISYPTRAGSSPGADARPPRLRRAPARRARLRRKRGRPERLRLGRRKDIDAAVAWLQRRPDVADGRIGGIGFSVGGETMLEAAASNAGLRAVVSEGAGVRSVREHLLRGPRGWFSLPRPPSRPPPLRC